LVDLVVLCYHGLSDSWPDDTAVAPGDFAAQIAGFLRRGYRGATFTEALTAPPSPRTLSVTFDDAAASVYERAVPVLAELGVPATVFVATDFPDRGIPMGWPGLDAWVGGEHERELRCMTWDQLGSLTEQGWEVGSHTCSHPRLTTLGDEQLAEELVASKGECERRLDRPCRSLAYPYSDVDSRVARATQVAGYAVAATVPTAPARPLPLLWPRVGVYRGEGARRVWLRARRRSLGLVPLVDPLLSAMQRVTGGLSR
jgi:peptidoglycan/xylan/chitin deacetylase (PgdA/CDA1 family)